MTESPIFRPIEETELTEAVAKAAADGTRLRIRGGGSKDRIGAPSDAGILDMTGFAGVIDYDPPELVLTVRAATPLSEVEELLASNGQMLAFSPWDPASVFGERSGRATIGGTIAAGLSGSQRLTQGAARDHLLGFAAVSGRGERFVAGAKVVKNVTGYDLPKLMAGSWGRLAVLTEVTLKVLPRPLASITVVAEGLSPREAWKAMADAMRSRAEVAAAAHLPVGTLGPNAVTALRVQGFAPSVEARCQLLEQLQDWRFVRVDEDLGSAIWGELRTLTILSMEQPLWRISLPARSAPDFLAEILARDHEWLMDWAGGLIWYAGTADANAIRLAADRCGGHAMAMRVPEEMRSVVPAFHPAQPTVAALEERVRRAFDPAGVFENGRF